MKRRSFLTTAFAALGLGRLAAEAEKPATLAGFDPAHGKDQTAYGVAKIEHEKGMARCRLILQDLRQSDNNAKVNIEKILALHSQQP